LCGAAAQASFLIPESHDAGLGLARHVIFGCSYISALSFDLCTPLFSNWVIDLVVHNSCNHARNTYSTYAQFIQYITRARRDSILNIDEGGKFYSPNLPKFARSTHFCAPLCMLCYLLPFVYVAFSSLMCNLSPLSQLLFLLLFRY